MLDVFLTTYEVRKNVGGFILQNVRTHIVSNACDGRGIMLSLSPTCVCVCVCCARVSPIISEQATSLVNSPNFPRVFRLHISQSYGRRRHNNSSRNKTIPLCLNLRNITGNDSLINSPTELNGCQSPAVINIHLSDNVRVDLSENAKHSHSRWGILCGMAGKVEEISPETTYIIQWGAYSK